MALEFNADRQQIKSDQLKIKNDTSVRFDLGAGADEKVAVFGTLTNDVDKLVRVGINTTNPLYELDVDGQIRTTTSIISDTARIQNLDIDTIVNPSLNLKAPILNTFTDPNTGEVFFPRSATPAFADDSNKVATTNFVYNIATNDVGGRIYVSQQIGSDTFDGRSATKPVRTIKRATQLAAETGDKETLIVAGGDYLEDNPISLPDLCSVVGDNIRLCIVRPANPGKHMFKASNENYVTGITFRDQIDSDNVAIKTWSFAYVFDDKQRFFYPRTLGGQFGRTFNLGHKIAAAQEWELTFTSNGGGVLLVPGITLNGPAGGTGVITSVTFDTNTDQSGTLIINDITGTIESTGGVYTYEANNPVVNYNLSVTRGEQLTPDAQVVKHVTTHLSYAVTSVKTDPAYPDGLVFTTVDYHDYEVGQYLTITNLPSSGLYADLDRFNGRQYISHRIETDDGFSKKFVVYKDTPTDLAALGAPGGEYGVSAFGVLVESADNYVVFSLDNSPRKFDESVKSPNRYLDAVDLIGRNETPIAKEAIRRTKEEYPLFTIPDESQCETDIKHIVNAIAYDLTWGGNAATKEAADNYFTAGALNHIQDQLKETSYAFAEARDLSIQAMRNQLNYVSTSSTASITRPTGYTGQYRSVIWDNEKFVAVGEDGAIHTSTNGTTWTAQTSGTTEVLKDIRWNKWAIGERGVPEYVVVGNNGTVLWSNNAETWYSVTSGTTNNFQAIAYNGTRYVAVGAQGVVRYSDNVKTWNAGTSGTGVSLRDVIYNDDCDKFIAVGPSGVIIESSDGVTWSAQESGTSEDLKAISWSEGRMVAVGNDSTVVISDDNGLTWETNIINNNSPDNPQSNKDADAADLILANQALIANIAVGKMLANNSGYTIPTGNQACKDDIMAFIGAMVINLEFGGNDEVYDAANLYVTGSHVQGEEDESVEAFNYARDLCIEAMRNQAFSGSDMAYAEGLTQVIDNTVTTDTNTPLCATQASAITTFFGILTTAIGATGAPGSLSGTTRNPVATAFTGQANRYWDASDLILENKKAIAAQAVYQYTDANAFTVPTGNQNCIDDVVDVLEAIAHDLRHGGNAKTHDAAGYYVGTTHVDGEEAETVAIINIARDLAITAMRNQSLTLSYLTDNTFTAGLEAQFIGLEQFTKPDITIDGASTARCANVASAITTLTSIVTTAVTNDNLNHSARTIPTGTLTSNDHLRVFNEGNKFWSVSEDASDHYVHTSSDRGRTWKQEYTASGSNGLKTVAFSYTIGVGLGTNGEDIVFNGTGSEIDTSISNTNPVFQDDTISNTYDSNRAFACDNVASSLYTLWNIVIDRINQRTVPATDYASSYFSDSNNKFFNVGHAWDDLPIIEVSPYIFNSSVISFLGGNGCEIDGNKIATPNVRRPGLPPQGKSMVAAAFTIISFGGIGYNVINDGYTQLVSVFCIFTQDGAVVQTGGYASLTNSASNFGTFALRANGVREEAYSFDKGLIGNVTFTDIGVPKFTITGLGAPPLEHYIIAPGGFELENQGGQNPLYFIENTISATPVKPIQAEIQANLVMNVRGNYNRYTDSADQLERNARYIAEEAYFTTIATSTNTFDQGRNKCIRDTEEIVKAWAKDIRNDANDATWDAAKLYISGGAVAHIAGEEAATKEVIDTATTLAKRAINNLLQAKGTTAQTADYYVAQWTDEIPYVDNTITHDTSPSGGPYVASECANVQAAIQTLSDLFDEIIDNPSVSSPMPSTAERSDGFFTINQFNKDKLIDHPIDLKRPSICNSSSHTWEFAGSGNDYNALPQNGGTRGSDDTADFEQVSQNNGRVYSSGTDELGDFKIGYFAKVENRTGNITFGGTVTISEVEFLKIKGNNVVITGFSPDNTLGALELGGPGAADSLLPTQKAVKDYISNQLGLYIGRTYSTVPTPNALVQLDGSGRINIDQLPALRPFNIFTVADQAARLALEGPLAGDIAIQQDINISFILNNDLDSQVLEFVPATGHLFPNGSIVTTVPGNSQNQSTNFTPGRVKQVIVNNGGTGYQNGDTVTFTQPSGGTAATGTLNINGGQITGITITGNGEGYLTAPSTAAGTITINTSTGSNATITTIIRSRLECNILNSIKASAADTIDDQTTPTANTITLTDVINTSANDSGNWVQLTSSTIDASFITSGVINPARLANVSANFPASSLTYLRGDSLFSPAVSSMRIAQDSPIQLGSVNTANDYVRSVEIVDAGSGYTVGAYSDTNILGYPLNQGEGVKGTIFVADNTVKNVTITNAGTGYDINNPPTALFKDNYTNPGTPVVLNSIKSIVLVAANGTISGINILDGGGNLGGTPIIEIVGGGGVDATATCTVAASGGIRSIAVTSQGVDIQADFTVNPIPTGTLGNGSGANLLARVASVPKIFNDITIDINRVDDLTVSAEPFGNLGVVRLRKSQFDFATNGGATLKTGQGSGLDADTLDTFDSSYYTDSSNQQSGTLPRGRLTGEYDIGITGIAASANVMNITDARTSTFAPENFAAAMRLQWKQNNVGYGAVNEYLQDGGIYHSLVTVRRSGSSTDFSSGAVAQFAQTDNNNFFIRNSGPNHVGSLTITNGGAGYVNGTYTDVPLGGGQGIGLKATITVTGGVITNVELTDKGWGYNLDGGATSTFAALLPESIFGRQNTRQQSTPAVITATLAFRGGGAQTGNEWSSWKKVWHEGNMGKDSGMDTDLMCGYNLRWFQNALNLSGDEKVMNSKIPSVLDATKVNNNLTVVVPDPNFQTNNGGHYDIYIEGHNITQEVLNSIDTQTGVSGLQLNLYTANDVNEGTIRVLNRRINLDPAKYETGTQYVEFNKEWTANATLYQRNDRIVYGYNIYRVANASSGNYTAGTVPPTHGSGTVAATGGTAQFEFERRVSNPFTILTVELISGNLNESVVKVGTLNAPAETYPVTDFGQTATDDYAREKCILGSDGSANPFLQLGTPVAPSTSYIDFHSSGNSNDYDVRISSTGGSSTTGTGTLNFAANNAQVNGNNIWHAGNISFSTGFSGSSYTTNANNQAVKRDGSGNFAANNITANLTGVASGNLALTGGTLTGTLTINTTNTNQISFTQSNKFITYAGGMQFRGSGSNWNSRFSTTNSSTSAELFGVYTTNFSTRIFSVTNNRRSRFDLPPNDTNGIEIVGQSGGYSSIRHYNGNTTIGYRFAFCQTAGNFGSGTQPGDIVERIETGRKWHYKVGSSTSSLVLDQNQNVAINQNSTNSSYKLYVNGSFAATSKSFVIDHPTKENHELRYGCLEGPEHAVYVRGRVRDGVIELPEYWTELAREETITVQLTAIGDSGNRWVIDVADNKVTTGGGDAFYLVQAERKDINKLEVEYEKIS